MRAVVTVISRVCSFLGYTVLCVGLVGAVLLLFAGFISLSLSFILVAAALVGSDRRWSGKFVGLTFGCGIVALVLALNRLHVDSPTTFVHETAAVKAIQTIQTAQMQYKSHYGRYATSLAELGPPPSGAPTAAAADLIDSYLARGEKSGYKFFLAGSTDGYTINANPMKFGVSGSRTFYSDQTQTFYENLGPEPATAHSKELK